MRIALGQFRTLDERALRFAAQIGASGVLLNTPELPSYPWAVGDLRALREQCEARGLRLEAIENVPLDAYVDAIIARPGRDAAIADFQAVLRNLGAAGIDTLGFHWMATGVARTDFAGPGRGGSRVTVFDRAFFDDRHAFDRVYAAEELWDSLAYFLDRVLPVAADVGVRLALHPDDPPVPMLQGVARLFDSVDGLERAMSLGPAQTLGLELCLGTLSEMPGDTIAAIRRLAARATYVHFRDVQGVVPSFRECFIDEGNYDPAAAMRALRDAGFDGFIIDDHVPLLDEDPAIDDGWAYHGHAHATGYLQGVLGSLASEAVT